VSVAKGERSLYKTIEILERNCKALGLSINKAKSGIMIVKRSQRERHTDWNNRMGYPIVSNYKYLGVMMLDDGTLRQDLEKRKKTQLHMESKMWLIRNSNLNGMTRVQLWHTIFKSRWSYAHQLLCTVCPKFAERIKSTHYQGMLAIMGMKHKPAKDRLFEIALG
jgi:hypothetical protein